jgi:hypothetical protein
MLLVREVFGSFCFSYCRGFREFYLYSTDTYRTLAKHEQLTEETTVVTVALSLLD